MSLDAELTKLTADELQLRLSQHALERPSMTDLAFAKWAETKDAIKFHLDLKRGEERVAWKDSATGAAAPPPPRLSFGRMTPLLSSPIPPTSEPEPLMSRKTPPPPERLEVLRKRLAACSNHKAAGLARMEIRKLCEAHGLPVPPEAELQKDSCPKKFRKAPATAEARTEKPEKVKPEEPSEMPVKLPPALVVFEAGEGPVEQLRQLRGLALGLLADLDDLPLEVAAQAHDEMALLKKVLVLGEDLIVRRTA